MRLIFTLLAITYLAVSEVICSQDVMKQMTINFAKVLNKCKKELDLPDTISTDFANFWKEGYDLTDPNMGCAIMCMSSKLELLDPDGKLHHGNTKDFAKTHGADDDMIDQLISLYHKCEAATPDHNDDCMKVLMLSKCFKAGIHDLNWAPNMELIVAEVLAEDDEMVKGFVNLLQECRNISRSEDVCSASLDFTNCFRNGCRQRQWVPNVST